MPIPNTKLFIDNNRFTLIKPKGIDYLNGKITLPYTVPDTEYRTVFGPVFCCDQNIIKNDAEGISGTLQRLLNKRKPERPGYHEELMFNQYQNVGGSRFHKRWVKRARHKISSAWVAQLPEIQRKLWIEAPHDKRPLRRGAEASIRNAGAQLAGKPYCRSVEYKSKPEELLPLGAPLGGTYPKQKNLRGVGKLSTEASLLLGYFIPFVKAMFATPFYHKNGRATFVDSPQRDTLLETFKALLDPKLGVEFVYFSDDSCIAIRLDDGTVLKMNCDISSCDGSNFRPVFNMLHEAMSVGGLVQEDIDGAFRQLELDLDLILPKGPKHCKAHRFKPRFKNRGQALFSGSVLTTIVNNMANMLIFMAIMNELPAQRTRETVIAACEQAAKNVGYSVTMEECIFDQQLQFLKKSPVYNENGELEVVVNLGTWLKGFGTAKGRVPGRSKIDRQRERSFLSSVVHARRDWGDSEWNDTFQDKFNRHDGHAAKSEELRLHGRGTRVSLSQLGLRYGLTSGDLGSLLTMITHANRGSHLSHYVIDRIMEVDYGMGLVEREPLRETHSYDGLSPL